MVHYDTTPHLGLDEDEKRAFGGANDRASWIPVVQNDIAQATAGLSTKAMGLQRVT